MNLIYQVVPPEYSYSITKNRVPQLWVLEPTPRNLYLNYKKSFSVRMEEVIGLVQVRIAQVIGQDNEWVICNLISEHIACAQFIAIPRRLNNVVPEDLTRLVQEDI